MIIYTADKNSVIAKFNKSYYGDSINDRLCWEFDIVDNIFTRYIKEDFMLPLIYNIVHDCLDKRSNFEGRAKCHPSDVFDVEIGKKLAKERLLKKYNTLVDRAYKKIINHVKNIPYVKITGARMNDYKITIKQINKCMEANKVIQSMLANMEGYRNV